MGRHAHTVTAGLVLGGLLGLAQVGVAGQAAVAPAPSSRLHPLSTRAARFIEDGETRSITLRHLVAELERSDLFVFVDFQADPRIALGETKLMTATDAGRYVRVVVNLGLNADRRLEMLGHELQHAVEIARAPEVRDATGLRAYLRNIGRELEDSTQFESEAARATERLVRRDLGQHAAAKR